MTYDLKAETVTITGYGGDEIEAYLAQPLDKGPYGGVVVIHHMPGYDEPTKEITRRFAARGYIALMPNLLLAKRLARPLTMRPPPPAPKGACPTNAS